MDIIVVIFIGVFVVVAMILSDPVSKETVHYTWLTITRLT